MNLTEAQKLLCERIVNVFETGSPQGDYGNVTVLRDGPGGSYQITYGRSQTTESGNLRELIQMYASAGGAYSEALEEYVPLIGSSSLVGNSDFIALLKKAGHEDTVMQRTQDAFFDKRYFQPALNWATEHGFTQALSMLVIYDSFIHSGSILGFLRSRFAEKTPSEGGDEKAWIAAYVKARQDWLATHSNAILHATVYRTQCFLREIARNNWDLSQLPIMAHGVAVADSPIAAPKPIQPSEEIKWLQASLNKLGADPILIVDGYAGPNTTIAIKSFQEDHDLFADGIVGPKTHKALEDALSLQTQENDPMSTWFATIFLKMLGSSQIQSLVRKLLTMVGTALLLKVGLDAGTASSILNPIIEALAGVVTLGSSFFLSAQNASDQISNPTLIKLDTTPTA